jgi:hypothetical protein
VRSGTCATVPARDTTHLRLNKRLRLARAAFNTAQARDLRAIESATPLHHSRMHRACNRSRATAADTGPLSHHRNAPLSRACLYGGESLPAFSAPPLGSRQHTRFGNFPESTSLKCPD